MYRFMKKLVLIVFFALTIQTSVAVAGTSGDEAITKKSPAGTTKECFEGVSRAMFKFNHGLDKALFKPVAKGYRALPLPIRNGTGNVIDNLRSLLTLSNNILQGDFREAGNTVGRFVLNTTVGIIGIWDPAASMGLQKKTKEDFGQTLGVWGGGPGCYFVLPVLGPTTVRDAVGLVGNIFIDPVYQITHNTEVFDRSYSEHNYYYYRGTGAVDFRAKNIETFSSLEKNSIDLYSSIKSLYLQNRQQRISNSGTRTETLDESDWEEIDTK